MTEREKLVEDLLREILYSTGEAFETIVEGIRQDGAIVRVRLRGHVHDFDVAWEKDTDRSVIAARLERKLKLAREGPDRSRPPIDA